MPVSIQESMNRQLQERWLKMRTHKRAIASLRFVVEWEDNEKPHCANGITVDVSHSGCMAVVGADLPLHRRVKVTLPDFGRSAQAEVVWRGHEAWDVGIEFANPDPAFWGVKIPDA